MLRIWIWVAGLAAAFTVVLGGAALIWAPNQDGLWPLLRPEATWTAAIVLALWLIALAAFAVPRREQGRPVLLLAIIAAAALATLLGLASTWRCTSGEDVFLTPVWQTLTLFVGTSPAVFVDGRCLQGVPLAVQLARTLAILAVFATAAAIAVNLLSAQMRRLLTRYRGLDEVVIGFDDTAAPLIRTLQLWRDADKNVVVLVEDESGRDTSAVRSLGAQVFTVRMDTRDPLREEKDAERSHIDAIAQSLTPFLTTHQRFTTPRIWIMEADPVRALEIKEAVDTLLKTYPPKQTVRVWVRCDDATLAGFWRSSWVGQEVSSSAAAQVLHDPLSRSEITAIELAGRLFRDGGPSPRSRPWQLVICGDTALAQAVGAEVAMRCWESAQLDQAWSHYCSAIGNGAPVPDLGCDPQDLLVGGCPPSTVMIVAPDPRAIEAQIVSGLSKAVADVWRSVSNHGAAGSWTELPDLRGMEHVELLVTDVVPAEQMHIVQRILSQSPTVERVWVRAAGSVAARPVSLAPGVEVYTESVLMHGKLPEDAWTASARIAHEVYRRRNFEAGRIERYPWWHSNDKRRTSLALRDDNLAHVRLLLKSVSDLGYMWRVGAADSVDLTDAEWWIVAEREHARWRTNQPDIGKSGNRDDRAWTQLKQASREGNRDFVRQTASLLKDYGYIVARAYRGQGQVRARQLAAHEGPVDSCLVKDISGQVERVVPRDAFTADFEAVGGDVYARHGEFSAHRTNGGWQVSDAHGNSWRVPSEHFDQWYRHVDAGPVAEVPS